jgi:hypothetical protein
VEARQRQGKGKAEARQGQGRGKAGARQGQRRGKVEGRHPGQEAEARDKVGQRQGRGKAEAEAESNAESKAMSKAEERKTQGRREEEQGRPPLALATSTLPGDYFITRMLSVLYQMLWHDR